VKTPLKSFAIVKGILEFPHRVGLVAFGDHQIKTALINVEKVSKWRKASMIKGPHFLGLGDCQLKTPLKIVKKCANFEWLLGIIR
jgi:hypothetical protein